MATRCSEARRDADCSMCSIKSLDDLAAFDHRQIGGKALNCARLLNAGFPVPQGFVVLAGAADDFRLVTGIEHALRSLPAEALLAVRSSASGEDSTTQSFAGIYVTKLNVKREDVLDAVRSCRASVNSPQAAAYRAALGLPKDAVTAGVLVQQMVQPVSSGVAFTVNPVTGATDEVVISASWGLGEAVVGGHVDADEFRVHKSDAKIACTRIGHKDHRIVVDGGAPQLVPMQEEFRDTPSLPDNRIKELTGLVLRVEHLFGTPQDVEWCFDGRQFWILQARPITATAVRDSRDIEWTRANAREVLPDLPSPYVMALTSDLLNRAFRAYYGALLAPEKELGPLLKSFCGRLYFNLSQFRHICLISRMPVAVLLRSIGHPGEITSADEAVPGPPLKLALRALPDLLRLTGMMLTMRRRFWRELREIEGEMEAVNAIGPAPPMATS